MDRWRWLVALAVAAGALLMLGAVLDWSGVKYSSRLDRTLAFAAGAFAVAVAVIAFAWRLRVLALAIGSGLLGLNMAIVNASDIRRHEFEYAAYPGASVGVGLYLVVVGGALALLVGLAALLPRRWLDRRRAE